MMPIFHSSRGRPVCGVPSILLVAFAVLCCPGSFAQAAQTFSSGSNGSDRALSLTTPGTVVFDPAALGLDPDGDNVYHFTTITIAAGVTVRLSAALLNGPVFWLASGVVQIDGTIDLNGENGQNGQDILNNGTRIASIAGAGGFGGGVGGTSTSPPQSGHGPGKGGINSRGGGGAGHATIGGNSASNDCGPSGGGGGPIYGSPFLVPLIGGSGGAGGIGSGTNNGGGGGAGGGGLLIASSVSITVNGIIQTNGGRGGPSAVFAGGGGSGGAIRLAAPMIMGTGTLSATGGSGGTGIDTLCGTSPVTRSRGHGGSGSVGRIRLEAFQHQFTGSTNPTRVLASPYAVFLPTTSAPSLRVVSVAGIALPNPTGSFMMPDATINTNALIAVEIEARNVPLTAAVKLYLVSENAPDKTVDFPVLVGNQALSTATVMVTLPSGFSRGYVRAVWTAQ